MRPKRAAYRGAPFTPTGHQMKRALSGIQPSGDMHIGNYFGSVRQFVDLQESHEAFYFIADYHSMTTIRQADRRFELTRDVALDYLACGLDPKRSVLFRQSDTPEVCELTWILSSVTPMGLLERAHAYKDKVAQGISADHGLFAYPVLMAADILIYRPDVVPVGQDQKQHVEIARDIAGRFNTTYGDVFPLPEPYIREEVATVPGVDGRKMSGSYGNGIVMFAPESELKKQVMKIVTDPTPLEDPKETDGVLFQLWSLFVNDEAEREAMFARARAGGLGYGEVKQDLLAQILEYFGPMRERRAAFAARPDDVEDILADGARRARAVAGPVLDAARSASGLGHPPRK